VVYRADQEFDNVEQYYSVPVTGGASVGLTNTVAHGLARNIVITPDSAHVVYLTDAGNEVDLYSVPLVGGTPVPIDRRDVVEVVQTFTISPDSASIVYLRRGTGNRHDVIVRSVDGGAAAEQLTNNGAGEVVTRPSVSPDGRWVVFSYQTAVGQPIEIQAVEIDNPTTLVTLSAPAAQNVSWLMLPDSSGIAYLDQSSTTATLFSARFAGGAPARLSIDMPLDLFGGYAVAPDGAEIVFAGADAPSSTQRAVFSVAPTGRSLTQLTPLFATGSQSLSGPEFTSNSRYVVYRADQDVVGQTELFAVATGARCGGLLATIVGTAGPDVLEGTRSDDVIVGLAGNDRIDGRGGRDVICGGSGRDALTGGRGPDRLFGGPGKDTLLGGRGPDRLDGGPGPDNCNGGRGRDQAVRCETSVSVP
jgi:Tol biopolymer transport system component